MDRDLLFIVVIFPLSIATVLGLEWYSSKTSHEKSPGLSLALLSVLAMLLYWAGAFRLGVLIAEFFGTGDNEIALGFQKLVAGFGSAIVIIGTVEWLRRIIRKKSIPASVLEREAALPPGSAFSYQCTEDSDIVDLGVMTKAEALEYAQTRFRALGGDSGEELYENHFGFSKRRDYFLEVSIISHEWGSYLWFETDELRFSRRYEIRKADQELVLSCIGHFFDSDSAGFLEFFQDRGAKPE